MAASIRAFGLGDPVTLRLPEDFSLGPLQDYRAGDEEEKAAFELATRFCEGMAEGKLDPKIFAPASRDALALLLAPPPREEVVDDPPEGSDELAPPAAPKQGELPFRIGRIELSAGKSAASMRVRLACAPGEERIEGLLSLGTTEGEWYVEAFSIDPGTPAKLAFDPSRTNRL